MATKKGDGVRGVLGDLVSKDTERKERSSQAEEFVESIRSSGHPVESTQDAQEGGRVGPPDTHTSQRKAAGIKGRPRARREDIAVSRGEKTKVTLSIDEVLRDQFYRLAHGEMMQPGEFVERALRYYIKHHAKRE